MMRVGVIGSTRGTHLLSLLAAIEAGLLPASIEVVLSNKQDALILEKAKQARIPGYFVSAKDLTRAEYDQQLTRLLEQAEIDLIVLIGYMRILSAEFVERWKGRIINVHPSLLPAFAGLMDLAVHQAVLDAGQSETGCTVHYVTAEVDAGPVVVQKKCVVLVDDTAESLKARVQALEGQALVSAVGQIAALSLIS